MKQSKIVKFTAFFALFGIIISIVGTGILVVYEMYFSSNNSDMTLTQEQLQELINSYSGTTLSGNLLDENLDDLINNTDGENNN